MKNFRMGMMHVGMVASLLGTGYLAQAVSDEGPSRDETPVLSSVDREPGGGIDRDTNANESTTNNSNEEARRGPGHRGPRPVPYPRPATPVWAVGGVGYYDATGVVQGSLRLSQMRYYGGIMASGEPVPQFQVMCDSAGHICNQPGYNSAAYGLCYVNTHYE